MAEILLKDQEIKQLNAISSNRKNHNKIYRGKCLTDFYTINEIIDMCESSKEIDIYIGDYIEIEPFEAEIKFSDPSYDSPRKISFTKENTNIICAGIDCYAPAHGSGVVWFLNTSALCMSYSWYETSDFPENTGYVNSILNNSAIPFYEENFDKIFNHRIKRIYPYLTNSVDKNLIPMNDERFIGDKRYRGATDSSISPQSIFCKMKIPNEIEVFGSQLVSSSYYDIEGSSSQLPLFVLSPRQRVKNFKPYYFWLSSIASTYQTAVLQYGTQITRAQSSIPAISVCPLFVL